MKCKKCNHEMEEFASMQAYGMEYNVIVFVCRNEDCESYGVLIGF